MQDLFKKYEIQLTSEQEQKFQQLLTIFMETNAQINLSSIRDEEGIIEKHFIDSILLKQFCSIEGKVLDLWTWGWFPWIPLNIMDSGNTDFTLVDSIWKKVKVVNNFITQLGLKNINAIQARAEELWQNKEHRGKYNMVVSRATAYLPTLLEYTIPLLSVWWIFVSYKLDNDDEIAQAKKALHILDAEIIAIKKYELAGQKRAFLFIQKIWETHKKYPRAIWEPLKNPIG